MVLKPHVLFLLAAVFVTGCSTTMTTRVAIDPAMRATLKFTDVEIASSVGVLPAEVTLRLKQGTMERLAKLPHGDTPTKMIITVKEYRIVSDSSRFWGGALAGSNRMVVAVKVTDEKGAPVTEFDIERSANPGGYGMFYDQSGATIDAVADGIAEALTPKK